MIAIEHMMNFWIWMGSRIFSSLQLPNPDLTTNHIELMLLPGLSMRLLNATGQIDNCVVQERQSATFNIAVLKGILGKSKRYRQSFQTFFLLVKILATGIWLLYSSFSHTSMVCHIKLSCVPCIFYQLHFLVE